MYSHACESVVTRTWAGQYGTDQGKRILGLARQNQQ
jgi:hypothetical protein